MSDTLDELHAQAMLALLAANPAFLINGQVMVFDGEIPNQTPPVGPPFVLVYTQVAWPRDGVGTGLDSVQDTCTTTAICHCAGLTMAAVRVVQMQVRSSLLNARPAIAGRSCSPIKQDDSQPPARDDTTGQPVFDAIATYSFTSTG